LAVVLWLGCGTGLAEEPSPAEANKALTAVTRRPSYVFASTSDGIFRASLATKKWERLKTPSSMPLNGTFASVPAALPLVFYIATKATIDPKRDAAGKLGLYRSRDDGGTWELVSDRDDLGPAVLLPEAGLFAIAGVGDSFNGGRRLSRSTDLGKTWRDISGDLHVNLMSIEPDPDKPKLVRVHGWAIRGYTITADDENYHWKVEQEHARQAARISSRDFFERHSSSSNRFYMCTATLSNYFRYDFGDRTSMQAFDLHPPKERFEFARGARVVIPVRVDFHYDSDFALAWWKDNNARGGQEPKPTPPTEKFADQPDGVDLWGLRVESREEQTAKWPEGRDRVTLSVQSKPDGTTVTTRSQPPRVPYKVFDLSPSKPYERAIDLGRLFDFAKPGEYKVQLIYSSGGHADDDENVWDGSLTSPVFTIVIRD
jgi:hypothetical protein